MKFMEGDYFCTKAGNAYRFIGLNNFGEYKLGMPLSWLIPPNEKEILPYLKEGETGAFLCSYRNLFEFDRVCRIQSTVVLGQDGASDGASLYMEQFAVALRREFLIEKNYYESHTLKRA
jgi:hypothetical protein